ncbi:hypothetical protein ACFLY7_00650 [Patescibacteria group bacterium]
MRVNIYLVVLIVVLVIGGFFGYLFLGQSNREPTLLFEGGFVEESLEDILKKNVPVEDDDFSEEDTLVEYVAEDVEPEKTLSDQIFYGTNDIIFGCFNYDDCSLKVAEKEQVLSKKRANQIFLSAIRQVYFNTKNLPVYRDSYLNGQVEKFTPLENVLTKESYEMLELVGFMKFIPEFVAVVNSEFGDINEEGRIYENFILLTAEQKQKFIDATEILSLGGVWEQVEDEVEREALRLLYEGGGQLVRYPDTNDSEFAYMKDREYDYKDGEIVFPEPVLDFPVFVINESRISVNLGEGKENVVFDLVKVERDWLVDLVEPKRPSFARNPRIVLWQLSEKEITEDWVLINSLLESLLYAPQKQKSFKEWWVDVSLLDKKNLLSSALGLQASKISNQTVRDVFEDFFANQISYEVEGENELVYEVSGKNKVIKGVGFVVSEVERGWNLKILQ